MSALEEFRRKRGVKEKVIINMSIVMRRMILKGLQGPVERDTLWEIIFAVERC